MRKFTTRFFIVFTLICLSLSVPAAAKSIKLSKTSVSLTVGSRKTLKVNTKKTVKWSSSNKKVATVSSKGVVTARKAGKATIKAKVGKKILKCKITVKKVSAKELSQYIGMTPKQIQAKLTKYLKKGYDWSYEDGAWLGPYSLNGGFLWQTHIANGRKAEDMSIGDEASAKQGWTLLGCKVGESKASVIKKLETMGYSLTKTENYNPSDTEFFYNGKKEVVADFSVPAGSSNQVLWSLHYKP